MHEDAANALGVIHVCHVIHELGPGGAEHVLVDLAEAAPSAGLRVSVLSLAPLGDHPYPRRLRDLGVAVTALDLTNRWDPRGLARGVAAVRALAPDVVHTHLKHADLVGAVAARRLGVPMVSTLHLIEDSVGPVGRLKRRLAAQARIRTAARTITVSDAQREWYLRSFRVAPESVETVHNGVRAPAPLPAGERRSLRAALGVPDAAVMATMVGVMRPGKGHAELLRSAALVPPDAGVVFVLAGDGPLRDELEAAAAGVRPGPEKVVVFAGFRDDVGDLLHASDLVVHPSLFEALPTALIYGLACGRPAVASDVGGIPEVVTRETGVLVPPGDVERFATAVTALARDPAGRGRLGAAARARFESEFEADIWARRLRRLYEEVIAGREDLRHRS